MRKRWGVRVMAIILLVAGFLAILFGVLPPVLLAARGAADWRIWLGVPTVLGGCAAALFLLAFGALLLTLVKIAENMAAERLRLEAAVAPAAGPEPQAPGVAVAEPAVTGGPVAAAVAAAPGATPAGDEVAALRAELAALEAQLAELDEYPAEPEEALPPFVPDEPLPDAADRPALPGAEEAARVAAEMRALRAGASDEGSA